MVWVTQCLTFNVYLYHLLIILLLLLHLHLLQVGRKFETPGQRPSPISRLAFAIYPASGLRGHRQPHRGLIGQENKKQQLPELLPRPWLTNSLLKRCIYIYIYESIYISLPSTHDPYIYIWHIRLCVATVRAVEDEDGVIPLISASILREQQTQHLQLDNLYYIYIDKIPSIEDG